ncbi:CHRD superfamily protein [Cordyceps javanica]|uniref:CHRD superfamily protein n=1 Tax=Cordyceps javanica TaxID=43265 RepID=A0A545VWL5_9HYPO|nr:CHRD superfamily protein [Cordyceps javanica]TQW06113.1 CHRD superfamily protein [Cordyceps javanica]
MKSFFCALGLLTFVQAAAVPGDSTGLVARHSEHGKEPGPFTFTSTFNVIAKPENVVDAQNNFTGGLQGSSGVFRFGINSHDNVICYNITITGFRGDYQSPARSATHIHEAAVGKAGPPRIAFPNPTGSGEGPRRSIGCLTGPFVTGVNASDKDTGDGFHVRQIEQNPAMFFADVHSSLAVPGAFRGQLGEKNYC